MRWWRWISVLSISVCLGCAHHGDRAQWVFFPEHPGSQALLFAVYAGDEEMALSLVGRGAPVNIVTDLGSLLDLASSKRMDRLVADLLEAGADPDLGHTKHQQPALHVYAATQRLDLLEAFLRAGVDLETRRADGMTPLAVALDHGRLRMVKALIYAGASVNAVYAEQSLLMHRVGAQDVLQAQLLLAHGADPTFRNARQQSVYTIVGPDSPFRYLLPASPDTLVATLPEPL